MTESSSLSKNAAALALLVGRSSASHVARCVGCNESAVRFWASGKRTPTAEWRAKLADFDAALAPDGWELPSADASDSKRRVSRTAPDVGGSAVSAECPPLTETEAPPRTPRRLRAEDRLEAIIAECDAELAEARKPGAHCSVRDRSSLIATKSNAALRLSRLRGEDAVSMRRILESNEWQEIKEVIFTVLARHPAGAAILAEIIAKLDAAIAGEQGVRKAE